MSFTSVDLPEPESIPIPEPEPEPEPESESEIVPPQNERTTLRIHPTRRNNLLITTGSEMSRLRPRRNEVTAPDPSINL